MNGIRNFKIGTKLIVSTSFLVISTVFIITLTIGFNVQRLIEHNAREIAREAAFHYAFSVKADLEAALDEARALAKFFEAIVTFNKTKISREEANLILKHFIEKSPKFTGVYVLFEPNAFDGKDAEYAGITGYDHTGRFITYWTHDEKGGAFLEPPPTNYDIEGVGDYYQLPKKKRKEFVIEPYLYPVQGKEILMTSLVVPILDAQKNFLGIAGIDLAVDQLQQQLGQKQISNFKEAFTAVYSAMGAIIAHKDISKIGKNVKEINTHNREFINAIIDAQPFLLERMSDILGKEVITYGAPVEIGYTGTRWMAVINVPKDELTGEALKTVNLTMTIGLVIVVFAILIVYFFSKKLVNPLLQVNTQLKILARGQLSQDEFIYQGKDEIAEMLASMRQLKSSIVLTIEQANAIAAGDFTSEIKLLSQADQLGRALTNMTQTLREVIEQAKAIAIGDYSKEVKILSEKDQLGKALMEMTRTLREISAKNEEQNWLKSGQAELNEQLSGDQDIAMLAKNVISFLTVYLEAKVGLFYLLQDPSSSEESAFLKIIATYAYTPPSNAPNQFLIGEGLVGEVALKRQAIACSHTPEEYTYIVRSSLSHTIPRHVLIVPILYENMLKGVIELGAIEPLTSLQQEFLTQAMASIGIAVNTAEARTRMQVLLDQSQRQSQELIGQQAELQQVNEELQSQTEELQTQQEELRQTNEELESRTLDLERQKEEIRKKNLLLEKTQAEMEKTRAAIEVKVKELELASKYKSEFLANMSHELRTPLNSLLILAQLLADNKSKNLTDKQVEYAKTIRSAGADLLTLINNILDLSKIEAGKIEAIIENVAVAELATAIQQKFNHVAAERGVQLTVEQDHFPEILQTDMQRLQQILNNLLSNAFKFTSQGTVKLRFHRPDANKEGTLFGVNLLNMVAISVIDTGIGIPQDKLQIIFEAFQQADGTTSRRYGGTGLGLSISRQLARLLEGELTVTSEEGKGSIFTLYLPITPVGKGAQPPVEKEKSPQPPFFKGGTDKKGGIEKLPSFKKGETEEKFSASSHAPASKLTQEDDLLQDDRNDLNPEDRFILIVEDDSKFVTILMEIAHEKGFKCLIASDGDSGLHLAETYKPHAIILDVGLPVVNGWTVMEKLKDNPETRHIPVHFISAADQSTDAKKMGAIGYLLKPVNMDDLSNAFKKIEKFIANPIKNLLIVAAPHRQSTLQNLITTEEITTTLANTLAEVRQYLPTVDCMVIDIDAPASNELLQQLQIDEIFTQVPIIVYTERELTAQETMTLKHCAARLTLKAVRSPERLLDEATLFLHQIESHLSKDKQKILRMVHDKEAILAHKKVLIVDDDARNVFALTVVLDEKNMDVLTAENGKEGLTMLEQHPDIDIVLMDIMMPEMDGYETMRHIREQPKFRKLPIIALTAKAMKDDKSKCIDAGANDYLAKPVDTDKLLSLMRVWLYQ